MRCDNVQSMLSAYADRELAPRQAARVAEHLTVCSSCRAEYQSLGHVVTALRALGQEDLPAGLHQGILKALDTARPSFWQRLNAALATQPVRPLAVSAAATALAVVAMTTTPLSQDQLNVRSLASQPYVGPSAPFATAPTGRPMTAPTVTPTAPPTMGLPRLQAARPVPAAPRIVPTSSETHDRQLEIAPRLVDATSPTPVAGATVRAPRRSGGVGGARRTTPAPMSTFDPLAPVLEPTGSRMDPPMANVVVAEPPAAAMPQPDSTRVATAPATQEVTPSGKTDDDLASLRQRLAQEQLRLPPVKLKPRPRSTQHPPLLHGEF